MKEAQFVRRHIEKWKKAELLLGSPLYATPDELVDAYNEVTSDLAFAQTHFPESAVTPYLNDLALALHHGLYRNKRDPWSRLITFWTHEIPLRPMAVYGGDSQVLSFASITINNVMVAFRSYVMGVFTSLGTCFFLMYNGIMVGAFVTFFMVRHLFVESILAIMLHGTLELSAIVIAGGAGITLGNGWLFPGTYSRMQSFVRAARHSVKVLISTVPVFVIAGFIEGFFTRYTEIGDAIRLLVILSSLAFVIFYYVLLPIKRHRDAQAQG